MLCKLFTYLKQIQNHWERARESRLKLDSHSYIFTQTCTQSYTYRGCKPFLKQTLNKPTIALEKYIFKANDRAKVVYNIINKIIKLV